MTYTLQANSTSVTRDADHASIPDDPSNTDWQAYQAWLAAGAAPTPAPAPAIPPVVLTFLQFMALFTPAEQAAIVSSGDVQTRLFMLMATGAGAIALADPEVVGGVEYLATTASAAPPGPGLLTSARVAQILANQPPT